MKTNTSKKSTTIDSEEIAKFSRLALQWWDPEGPLKTLHDINPCRMAFIEHYLSLAGCTVLDVGCGGGILTEAMAKKQASVVGIDADKDSIDVAKRHAEAQSLDIRYECSGIETFSADPVQVITCMEMLEHVIEPESVIHHCARLLQPGGYLFLSTLNRTIQSYLSAVLAAEYILQLVPKQTHDYQRFIKPSELATMVRSAGLELIDLKGMNYNPFGRVATLVPSVEVNYFMVCTLPRANGPGKNG